MEEITRAGQSKTSYVRVRVSDHCRVAELSDFALIGPDRGRVLVCDQGSAEPRPTGQPE